MIFSSKIFRFFSALLLLNTTFINSTSVINKNKLDKTYITKLEFLINKIKELHIEEMKDEDVPINAINGILKEMDPHSNLMNEEDYKDLMENTEGEFGGIGVEIEYKKGKGFLVITAIDDLPAREAGIRGKDMIIAVNDELLADLSQTKGLKKMRGKPGSKVKITVQRTYENGSTKVLSFDLVREIIKSHPIKYIIDEDIVYIRISTFDKNTFSEFYQIVSALKVNNIKGILLDLRSNPGGVLDGSIMVSDLLINKGVIVSTKGKSSIQTKEYRANPSSKKILDIPLVILVDNYSASASEIVAAAIQDNKRGLIVGENTFGKGSVQAVMKLDKDYAIKVTTALHYRPNGETIQGKGVTPDIIIPYEKSKEEKENDLKAEEDTSIKISESSYSSSIKPKKDVKNINKGNSNDLNDASNSEKELQKSNILNNTNDKSISEKDKNILNDKQNDSNNQQTSSSSNKKTAKDKNKPFNLLTSQTDKEKLKYHINNNQYTRAKDILKGLIIINNSNVSSLDPKQEKDQNEIKLENDKTSTNIDNKK